MKHEHTSRSPSFFGELGQFMQPYRGGYALSVALSVLGVAAGVAVYGFLGRIAGQLFSGQARWSAVLLPTLAAVGCKLLHAILRNCSTWVSHRAAYRTLRDIRSALAQKLLRLPMGYFEERGSGRLKALLVDHIENMEKTLAHLLPEMTADLLAPAACLVWMFFIDWRLTLAVLVWIVLGFSVTGGMMVGYEQNYSGQLKAFKAMNQAVVEYVGGIEVIKNFVRADACYRNYRDAVYGHAAYNVNWQRETQKFSALGMAIAPFSLFPVLILGLLFYQKGSLEAGTLILMVLLTLGIFAPLMNAMSYFDQLAAIGTNAKEIRELLDYPELRRGTCSAGLGADVDFSHVTFTYANAAEPAVRDLSFHVPAGSMLALVGPSGSGKSTIGKLLAGYWDADAGEITLAGHRLPDYSQEALNRLVAYVDQDTFLFDMTILDNIRLGCPDATDDQVMEAARAAGCDDFIRALSQGYHTMAGTAGKKLSGGEKQRISIARAMMKNAPILVLDEATASTDPENEASIQRALSAAVKHKTLIVIAHRLSTIVGAQQIAYVEGGVIRAMGTHRELLKFCPGYAALWALGEEHRHDR